MCVMHLKQDKWQNSAENNDGTGGQKKGDIKDQRKKL